MTIAAIASTMGTARGTKVPVVAKLVQTRAECKLVYILPSVAELRLSKHCLLRNVPLKSRNFFSKLFC